MSAGADASSSSVVLVVSRAILRGGCPSRLRDDTHPKLPRVSLSLSLSLLEGESARFSFFGKTSSLSLSLRHDGLWGKRGIEYARARPPSRSRALLSAESHCAGRSAPTTALPKRSSRRFRKDHSSESAFVERRTRTQRQSQLAHRTRAASEASSATSDAA